MDLWYKSPGDSGNLTKYTYYNDGKLESSYSKYPFEDGDYGEELEYNGNLVFDYGFSRFYGERDETHYFFTQLFRYDDLGRLMQIYYPDSPQIEGAMITEYYY